MVNSMVDYQNVMAEQLETITKVVAPFKKEAPVIEQSLAHIEMLYTSKLKQLKPQIMFFGIYNAGKSSILNEILQEDRALVADKPTTDKVDYYEWNGYQIADTPGVGAPIAHQEVTMAHLRKADVVIFVMSTTGSHDKKENYTRMRDIVDAGKKVIVVLNDKNGDLGRNNEVIEAIIQKVRENIEQIGIAAKSHIVVVNAARARKGRLEHKAGLVKLSNIAELEQAIRSELKNTTGYRVIRNTIIEAEKSLEAIINCLKQGREAEERQGLERVLHAVQEQKITTRKVINDYIKSKTERLAKILPDELWATQGDEVKAKAIVNDAYQKVVAQVQAEYDAEVSNMLENLEVELANFVTYLKRNLPATTKAYTPGQVNALATTAQGIITAAHAAKEEVNVEYEAKEYKADNVAKDPKDNPVIKALQTKEGKALATAVLGKVIGGRLAGAVVPVIGTLWLGYTILSALFGGGDDRGQYEQEAAAANARAQAKLNAEMEARQNLRQKCVYLAEDMCEQLMRRSNEALNAVAQSITEEFTQQLSSKKDEESARLTACATLNAVLDKYEGLRQQLEGLETSVAG